MANSNSERLAYGKETGNWGVVPTGAGASQFLRYTSVNSQNDKQSIESAELVNTNEVADIIQVSQRGGLSFGTELSYGNLDDLLESVFSAAWSANVLLPGVVRKSITFERQFSDITRFWTYPGGFVSQLQIAVAIGRIITAGVTVQSNTMTEGSASGFTGGGTIAAPTNAVMDPIASIQLLQEGGSGSIAGVTEVNLSFARGIVDQPQIASIGPLSLSAGQLQVSGSFSCYFADATYIAKHLSHVTTSLAFTLGGASSLKYAFLISKCKLTVPDVPNPGINTPLVQRVEFKALKDATNQSCKITRTP